MRTWVEQLNARASMVHNQIMAATEVHKLTGMDTSEICKPYWSLLNKLYNEELPLARLLDMSDVVLHAEGDSMSNNPNLHAVNWLNTTAEKQLKHLAQAALHLSNGIDITSKNFDLRLTSSVNNESFYAGFKIKEPEQTALMNGIDDPVFALIKKSITDLTQLGSFFGKKTTDLDDIKEAFPDVAIRDATLTTALHLSPTGKMGIDTIELSIPNNHQQAVVLSKQNRAIIRKVLSRPVLHSEKNGEFVGRIREMDLDARRFHLRGISTVGEIRCVLPESHHIRNLKDLLDCTVTVKGKYEVDENDRPRFMIVSSIDVFQRDAKQFTLN